MDAFEQLVVQLLNADGYWVKSSVKIDLNKEEKRKIGKPSAPKPEIDIAAFDTKANKLWLIEVKSYLDSDGVKFSEATIEQDEQSGLYKLLTCKSYRQILTKRLVSDWKEKGYIDSETKISYGLVAGKIYQNKQEEFRKHFSRKKWFFWGPSILKEKLEELSESGYENNAVTIAAKILMR